MARALVSTRTGHLFQSVDVGPLVCGQLERWPDFVVIETRCSAVDLPPRGSALNLDALPLGYRGITDAELRRAVVGPGKWFRVESQREAAFRAARPFEVAAWRGLVRARGIRRAIEAAPNRIIEDAISWQPWLNQPERLAIVREHTPAHVLDLVPTRVLTMTRAREAANALRAELAGELARAWADERRAIAAWLSAQREAA